MSEVQAARSSFSLQVWSVVLPIIKCAVCPACLSLFGGLFAGARIGLLEVERYHVPIILVALVLDFLILRAAWKHHGSRWPLLFCLIGGVLALGGHFVWEPLELTGFLLLMIAAIHNVVLLRRHHREGGNCCAHDHSPSAQQA